MKKLLLTPVLMGLVGLVANCAPRPSQPSAEVSNTIRFGAAVSETGKFAREGKDTRQGYDLWRDWVNEEYGGVQVGDQRYPVEIVYYDDEGNPDTVARLAEKLITEDQVDFLLAPYSSGLTKSASAIAEKYNTLMVAGGASSDSLFTRGFSTFYSVMTPASRYTESALQALSKAGAKTVVIAYEDTPFPTSVAEGAQQWTEQSGMEVLAVETYPRDVADVSAIINKFKALNPDVFVGGGHFNDALLFVRAAKELDFNPNAIIITVGPSNPQFADEMGADADYVFGPTQWESTMGYEDEYFGTAQAYAERYEAMWGEPPTYQAAGATAVGLVLQLAIEAADSLETDAVRQAMNELNVQTFYGPIQFDQIGRNAAKPMGGIQILNGQIKVVAPESVAVTDMAYPLPAWKER